MQDLDTKRFGPQFSGDNAFTARMRKHQSWWRSDRLGVGWGTNKDGNPYGNYLLEVDAERGLNFLTPAIHHRVREQIKAGGRGIEPFRCPRNLLSSQPMAFNLFGPLCDDRALAARLLSPLLPGGVSDAKVWIEWAPTPPANYLSDRTSFDVYVRYTTAAGQRSIAAIETKLTEPFTAKCYLTETYREVARKSSVWRDPMDDRLIDRRWNQVWRNHLLVESIRHKDRDLLGCQVVVHHDADERCAANVRDYTAFLVEPEHTFRCFKLGEIVESWRPLLTKDDHLSWIGDFQDRYLNLGLSEAVSQR